MEEELTNWGHLYLFAKRTLSASKKAIACIALHDSNCLRAQCLLSFCPRREGMTPTSHWLSYAEWYCTFFYTSLCVSRINDMYQNLMFWPYLAATPSKSAILQNVLYNKSGNLSNHVRIPTILLIFFRYAQFLLLRQFS